MQFFLRDGEVFRLAAHNGFSLEYQEYVKSHPIAPGRGHGGWRAPRWSMALLISPTPSADPEYPIMEGRRAGWIPRHVGRAACSGEGICLGVMAMDAEEARPFTDQSDRPGDTFANQAMIAIENVRLFNAVRTRTGELSESLEQQTATSRCFSVISSSPGDLEPVFQVMLENATRICDAKFGNLWLREGDGVRVAAFHGHRTNTPKGSHLRKSCAPAPACR